MVLAAAAVGRGAWQHVPYRTCKLTHVLKDCLGGNCATLLIANVWGEAAQLDETLSTCSWGVGTLADAVESAIVAVWALYRTPMHTFSHTTSSANVHSNAQQWPYPCVMPPAPHVPNSS